MAYDKTRHSYDVQPVDNPDGTLAGLKIIHQVVTDRVSEDGKLLRRGNIEEVESIEIPNSKLDGLIQELFSWPLYYASGEAARDSMPGKVNWPKSRFEDQDNYTTVNYGKPTSRFEHNEPTPLSQRAISTPGE